MKTKPQSNQDDIEFKVLYWLIIIGAVISFFACIAGCAWLMWIVTKVVAG